DRGAFRAAFAGKGARIVTILFAPRRGCGAQALKGVLTRNVLTRYACRVRVCAMWGVGEILRSRLFPRAAVLALTAASVAACRGDTLRFNKNPSPPLSHSDPPPSTPQTQAAKGAQPNPPPPATPASSGSVKAVALNSPARSGSGDAAGS